MLLFPHCCQEAQEIMTMFIDISTRQIINYLGFFSREVKRSPSLHITLKNTVSDIADHETLKCKQ